MMSAAMARAKAGYTDGDTDFINGDYGICVNETNMNKVRETYGFLHGICAQMGAQKALEFGLAAAAIKHTIPGDLNFITEEEVLSLMGSEGSGRVQR